MVHPYAALAFCRAGRATVDVGGVFSVERGDVLLVPAGAPHGTLRVDGAEYWGLALCTTCLAQSGDRTLLEPFARVRDGASPVSVIDRGRVEFVELLFRELEEVTRARTAPSQALTPIERSLVTLLLHEVTRGRAPQVDVSTAGLVARALAYIEQHCLRPLPLDEVARHVGVSPSHLTRSLARATGHSAGTWIIRGKLAEARRLLARSDAPVDDVAHRVGYADATHFIRMFRRHHGVTPAAWRRQRARF